MNAKNSRPAVRPSAPGAVLLGYYTILVASWARWERLRHSASDGASARHESYDDDDEREDEEQVNDAAGDV
jgi:hypothetical protein